MRENERHRHAKLVVIIEKAPGHITSLSLKHFQQNYGTEGVDFLMYREEKTGFSGHRKTQKNTIEAFHSMLTKLSYGRVCFDNAQSLNMSFLVMSTAYDDYLDQTVKDCAYERDVQSFSDFCAINTESYRNMGGDNDIIGHGFRNKDFTSSKMIKEFCAQLFGYGSYVDPKTQKAKITGKGKGAVNDDLVIAFGILCLIAEKLQNGTLRAPLSDEFYANISNHQSMLATKHSVTTVASDDYSDIRYH